MGAAGLAAFSDEDVETTRLLGQIIAIALHRAYTYPRPRQDVLPDADARAIHEEDRAMCRAIAWQR